MTPPPPAERDRKLTVLLALEELSMLEQLAEDDGRSVSQMVRVLVKNEHAKRFGPGVRAQATAPTIRGIVKDLTGRAHYTAGNIAERAQLPLGVVLRALDAMKRAKLVECVDGAGVTSTWESKFGTYEDTINAALEKKIDVDVKLA